MEYGTSMGRKISGKNYDQIGFRNIRPKAKTLETVFDATAFHKN